MQLRSFAGIDVVVDQIGRSGLICPLPRSTE
jgi:hypothetical protein